MNGMKVALVEYLGLVEVIGHLGAFTSYRLFAVECQLCVDELLVSLAL